MKNRAIGIGLCLLGLWAAYACGSGPFVLQSDWTLYHRPGDGFAVALPGSWRQLDRNPRPSGSDRKAPRDLSPEIARLLEFQERNLIPSDTRFIALEWPPKLDVFAFVAIANRDLPEEWTLKEYIRNATALYGKLKTIQKPIYERTLTLIPGDAAQLEFRMLMPAAAGKTVAFDVSRTVIIKARKLYEIIAGVQADEAKRYAPVFEKIVQSFQLLQSERTSSAIRAGGSGHG